MESGSDDSEHVCPLCMEEMDLTDRRFQPCQCGYQICLWCWHQIMELAVKNNTEGKCPACRTPYDKEKIVSAAPDPDELNEIGNEKKQKAQKMKPRAPDGRKHLSNVRVVQKNLVYVVGLPLTIADDEILERREYFGQYGKIMKTAVSRSTTYNAAHSASGPTASVYVTFVKEEDALKCIQAVDGCLLEGKQLRACFGTTKYCNAWLKNVTCNNPDCLYLHEIGTQEDSFTKEEMIAKYGSKHQNFHESLHASTKRIGPGLPPPPPDPPSLAVSHAHAHAHAHAPAIQNPSQTAVQLGVSAKPSSSVGPPRTSGLPPASSWGAKAGALKTVAQAKLPTPPATKLRTTGVPSPSLSPSPGGPVLPSTASAAGTILATTTSTQGVYRPSAAVLSGRVIQASAHPPPIVSALSLSTSPSNTSPLSTIGRQANGVGIGPISTTTSSKLLSESAPPVSAPPGSSPPVRQGLVIIDSGSKQNPLSTAQPQVKFRTRQVVVATGTPQGLSIVNGVASSASGETLLNPAGALSSVSSQSAQGSWPDSVSSDTSSTVLGETSHANKTSHVLETTTEERTELDDGSASGNPNVSSSDLINGAKGSKQISFAAVASAGAARSAAANAIRGLHVSNGLQLRTISDKPDLSRVVTRPSNLVTSSSTIGEEKEKNYVRTSDAAGGNSQVEQLAESGRPTMEGLESLGASDEFERDACPGKDEGAISQEEAGTVAAEEGVQTDLARESFPLDVESERPYESQDSQSLGASKGFDKKMGGFGTELDDNSGMLNMQASEPEPAVEITLNHILDAKKEVSGGEAAAPSLPVECADRESSDNQSVVRSNDADFGSSIVKPLNVGDGNEGQMSETSFVEEATFAVNHSEESCVDSGQLEAPIRGVNTGDSWRASVDVMRSEATPVEGKDDSAVIEDILRLDFDIWGEGPFSAPGDLAKLLFSGVGTDRVKVVSSQQVGQSQNTNASRAPGPAKQSRFQFARRHDDSEEKVEDVSGKSLYSGKYPFEATAKNGYHGNVDEFRGPLNLSGDTPPRQGAGYFNGPEDKISKQSIGLVVQTPVGVQSSDSSNSTSGTTLKAAASSGLTAPPGFSAPLLAPSLPASSPNIPSGLSAPPGFSKPQGFSRSIGADVDLALPLVREAPQAPALSASSVSETTLSNSTTIGNDTLEDLEFVDPAIMAVGRGVPEPRTSGPPHALQNPAIGWLFGPRPPPPPSSSNSSVAGTLNANAIVASGGFPPGISYQPQPIAQHLGHPPLNFNVPLAPRPYAPSPYPPPGFSAFPVPFPRMSTQMDSMFQGNAVFAQNTHGQLLNSQLGTQPGNISYGGSQAGISQSGGVGLNKNSNVHVNAIPPGLQFLRNFPGGPYQSRHPISGMTESHVGNLPLSSGFPSMPVNGQNHLPLTNESYASNMEVATGAAYMSDQSGSQMGFSAVNTSLTAGPKEWQGAVVDSKFTSVGATIDSHGTGPENYTSIQDQLKRGHDGHKSEETIFSAPTSRVTSPLLSKITRVSTPEAGVSETISRPIGYAKRALWDRDSSPLPERVQEVLGSHVLHEHGEDDQHGLDKRSQNSEKDNLEVGERFQDVDSRHTLPGSKALGS